MSESLLANAVEAVRVKPARPQVVALDVIGTLFPREPLRPRIRALGLAAAGLESCFAAGLTTEYLRANRPCPAVTHAPEAEVDSLPSRIDALPTL